jgi:hypothetical protein
MTDTVTVNIGKKFSRFPSGRTPDDSAYSGLSFREKHLTPYLKDKKFVQIEFDDAISYGSSFLEEAFGGLVREAGFAKAFLRQHLKLKSYDRSLIDEVWSYIDLA